MQTNFKQILFAFSLMLLLWACENNNTPDFELGRYEYAGIDNKTFRFFRVENSGVGFREVFAPKTGIGYIQVIPFCDGDFLGKIFYDCGLFPNLPRPYIKLSENEAELALYRFFFDNAMISTSKVPYKTEGDSLVIGELPDIQKLAHPMGSQAKEIHLPFRVYLTSKIYSTNVDLVVEPFTELDQLRYISKQEKLKLGDTIAMCLLKEKFVKQ